MTDPTCPAPEEQSFGEALAELDRIVAALEGGQLELEDSMTRYERGVGLLKALKAYGKEQGWTAIEGYPFDRETIDRLGDAVTWPGFPEDFAEAGFTRVREHWLNSKEHSRSIYQLGLATEGQP